MTLSLGSRQHRKSMLPTPRLSSRISSRRAVSSGTSRIAQAAQRVPSPLLATPHNNGSTAQQARVPQPEENCKLSLPKQLQVASTWQAGLPSRIPGLLGQASCCPTPTPEQSDASSSLISAPRPEVKKAGAQDPTPPPPSAGLPKGELRLNSQEGRTVPARHQEPETRNPAAASSSSSARLQHSTTGHRASTAFAAGFSRIENTSSGDGARAAGALPSSTRKKSSFTTSVGGKENRQPQLRTRVPAPPVMPPVAAVSSVLPRSIRRTVTVVAQPSCGSFRESHPRPLVVVKKRTSHTHAPAAGSPRGDSRIRSAAAGEPSAGLGFPAGIKALMEDVDCFAREWTEIFDELLSAGGANGPEGGRPSKLDSFTRIHPSVQPESAGMCQADGPATEKRTHKPLLPAPSGSAGSASTLQVSPLVSIDGEMIHIDAKPVSLARWQHRENAMAKDASVNDKSERDSPGASSTLGPDHPGDCGNRHPQKDVQNASLPPTHRASRYYLHLPEINQSPIISGSHLGEMTSVGTSNRKDELAKLPESHPITPRGANRTRPNGSTHHARIYPSATLSSVSSPFSTITSLSSASNPYLSSPWVNLQGHECSPQRIVNGASDAELTRSSSLRGLRAIFKRTSAGLTSGQRQRAESLKGLISEPRILSLGSISITNLRDAGVARGGRPEENPETTGELARKTTVKW